MHSRRKFLTQAGVLAAGAMGTPALAAAEKAAADDNRSLTSLFETLLLSHLRDHGYSLEGAGSNTRGAAKKPRSTGKSAARAR